MMNTARILLPFVFPRRHFDLVSSIAINYLIFQVIPLVSQLIKQISEDFPQEYQSIVIALPPDAASLMSA